MQMTILCYSLGPKFVQYLFNSSSQEIKQSRFVQKQIKRKLNKDTDLVISLIVK